MTRFVTGDGFVFHTLARISLGKTYHVGRNRGKSKIRNRRTVAESAHSGCQIGHRFCQAIFISGPTFGVLATRLRALLNQSAWYAARVLSFKARTATQARFLLMTIGICSTVFKPAQQRRDPSQHKYSCHDIRHGCARLGRAVPFLFFRADSCATSNTCREGNQTVDV